MEDGSRYFHLQREVTFRVVLCNISACLMGLGLHPGLESSEARCLVCNVHPVSALFAGEEQ